MSLTTFARKVFYLSFIENRVLSSTNPLRNSLYCFVVLITSKLQALNFVNKGIDVK
jgi:hypothetical protein